MDQKLEIKYVFLLGLLVVLGISLLSYMGYRAYHADIYLDSEAYLKTIETTK